MSNNKEIICKLIKAKNQEANSYTDRTCYNAAYCYGYVDGATMALNTLSDVPERHKCYTTFIKIRRRKIFVWGLML